MKEERAAPGSLTKEDIKRAAVLALHTYDGATAAEWQDEANSLLANNLSFSSARRIPVAKANLNAITSF